MGLFDMTFETGVWEFRHRILAPIAMVIILPIIVVLYGIAMLCLLLLRAITGDRSIHL